MQLVKLNKYGATEREQNIVAVLSCIIEKKDASTQEIAQKTSLSFSTISRVVNRLISSGIIRTTGKEVTDTGRRPNLLSLNGEYGYLAVFELNAGSISGVISSLDGVIIAENSKELSSRPGLTEVMAALESVYRMLLCISGLNYDKIMAAGVSIPGVFDETSCMIRRIPDLAVFGKENMSQMIRDALGIPVIIDNVSRLSALGEKIAYYPDIQNMIYMCITQSYGIGSGLIINGDVYRGSSSAAGEIGEMFFDVDNFARGNVRHMGSMERFSGIMAIYETLYDTISMGGATKLRELLEQERMGGLTIELVERAIGLGDYDVEDIYEEALKIWSMAIINSCALLDPQLVVVGGVISDRNQLTMDKLRHYVQKGFYYAPDIRPSLLGQTASRRGGICALQRYVYNNILAYDAIK